MGKAWMLTALAIALSPSACAPVGARNVPDVHASYNDALVRTQNTQFLLNMVRMRYRDTPFFVDVTSVTNQQTYAGSFGLGTDLGLTPGTNSVIHPNLGGSYSVTPTVVYTPLQGEAFVRRLVTPVSLSTVLTLATAGWSASRVLRLTVDRMNDVRNAPSAAGPTPREAPPFQDFLELAAAVRQMQNAGTLEVVPVKTGESEACVLVVDASHGVEGASTIRRLLGVDVSDSYLLVPFDGTKAPNRIHMRMRSVLSTMYYLSEAIEVPPADEGLGLVTVTKSPDGTRFDWKDVFYNLFRVRWSDSEPRAFVKTFYRNHWFYIADDDLDTKTTFQLMTQLFSMQAGQASLPPPVLTIGAGGR